MELDILKQNTTWNDASASINNNFAKVKTALEQGGGGGGTGGGGEEEVYVGGSEPQEESVLLWVDTNAEEDVELAKVAVTGSYKDLKDKPEFATVNGQRIDQGGNIEIEGGSDVTVDTQMSDTSENAVQNKVIKRYVDDEVEDAKAYSEEMADNAEKAAKKYADDNKVAKVDGKQLSTEDFTTALKQKLDGLTNYDDADVKSAITELQNDLDAIVNGDATSAIDSIQEILAFLSTITDTQTLAGIVADLKQYVDDKVASGGGGSSVEVDSEMSDTSTNPVGNKVIKEYVDGFVLAEFSQDFNDDFTN